MVMAKGKVSQSPLFSVRYLKTDGTTRIAAVAGQKIFKKATERTTLRRRMYETIRPLYTSLLAGYHVALFAKASAVALDHQTLASEIKKAFVKAGLIR